MLWPLQVRAVDGSMHSVDGPRIRRPSRIGLSALATSSLVAILASTASSQVLLEPQQSAPVVYPVGSLDLQYARESPDQPSLSNLLPIQVWLQETEFGWAAPRKGDEGTSLQVGGAESDTIRLEASGLARVMRSIVSKLNATGIYGIDVRPSSSDIDLDSERDLRPAEQTSLSVTVTVGRIQEIRTIAVGERIPDDWTINNEAHAQILARSPLQPTGAVGPGTGDLLNRRELEDYLYRLNRHRGRRVEAALSPSEEPGGIVLDYRVIESKPWFVYGQASNTGTRRTSAWQSRFGATHGQFTGRDDILSVEYMNSGGDGIHGVQILYQAPFFGPERPEWMLRRKGDPRLLDWIPREKIPWWGVDRLRWEMSFGWAKASADRDSSQAGLAEGVTSRGFQYAGRFIYETLQIRDFFVDLSAGLRIRDVRVRNPLTGDSVTGDAVFVLPMAGIHAERINQLSTLKLDVTVRGSTTSIDEGELDRLGRDETDDQFAIIDFDLGYSAFLEPILSPKAWRDPSTELSSTLAHEIAIGVRGQYAFDYRLVPQVSGTLGGLYSVRGYDQSAAVGDTIIIASAEYRFHLPRALPVSREPLRIPLLGDFRAAPQQVYGRPDWDLTLRAFVDFGRSIRNDGSSTGGGAAEFNQTLIGAGVGAELQLKSNFRARIDWGTALKATNGPISNPSDVGDSKIHVLFSILY